MAKFVLADALGVDARAFQHLAIRELEVSVVLEEVHVPKNMGYYYFVLQDRVGVDQEGIRRIGIDHQLVDLAQPVVVQRLELLIGTPVRPM